MSYCPGEMVVVMGRVLLIPLSSFDAWRHNLDWLAIPTGWMDAIGACFVGLISDDCVLLINNGRKKRVEKRERGQKGLSLR